MYWRIRNWWGRRQKRKAVYEESIRGYQRECMVIRLQLAALQELFREKQGKINRLQAIVRLKGKIDPERIDMRPEVPIPDAAQLMAQMSEDFDRRIQYFEETASRDRQERVTTRDYGVEEEEENGR